MEYTYYPKDKEKAKKNVRIQSKPTTPKYEQGYERIDWGRDKNERH